MNWKQFARDYLSFSRKDRIGAFVLLFLILLFSLLPRVLSSFSKSKKTVADSTIRAAVKNLEQKESNDFEKNKLQHYSNNKGVIFHFDPNSLDTEGWKKLGIREKTIQTILNFRNKGGKFRKPEDLRKIYGLRNAEYERLAPYINIRTGQFNDSQTFKNYYPVEKKSPARNLSVDINTGDTTGFIALPGIGSKLAARIILFREKLGGFYAVDQVKETFGLHDSIFQKIKPYLKISGNEVRKININSAGAEELKAHPYIRWTLANPIIAYRNEHGPFTSISQLKNIMAINEDTYKKIEPYLVVE